MNPCCFRCKTPGFGCAKGSCPCHGLFRAAQLRKAHEDAMKLVALALANPDVPPSLPKSADLQTGEKP